MGNGNRWKYLYELNKDRIKNPAFGSMKEKYTKESEHIHGELDRFFAKYEVTKNATVK